jgi:hypothetical protein
VGQGPSRTATQPYDIDRECGACSGNFQHVLQAQGKSNDEIRNALAALRAGHAKIRQTSATAARPHSIVAATFVLPWLWQGAAFAGCPETVRTMNVSLDGHVTQR